MGVEPLFAELKKQTRVAIDVGSSYGFTIPVVAEKFDQVHAFEIDREVRWCLGENVKEYSNVRVHNCGISDANENVVFNAYKNSGHTSVNTVEHRKDRIGKKSSYVRTIDSFGFTDVDYIKIDVEGLELAVLHGAAETLKTYEPIVLIEMWTNRDNAEVIDFFEQYGYKSNGPWKVPYGYKTKSEVTDDWIFIKQ